MVLLVPVVNDHFKSAVSPSLAAAIFSQCYSVDSLDIKVEILIYGADRSHCQYCACIQLS